MYVGIATRSYIESIDRVTEPRIGYLDNKHQQTGSGGQMKRVQFLCIGMLIAFVLAQIESFGQVNAVVTGTVSDTSGALIPGVEVTAKNTATGIVTTRITNEAGAYDFASLQPGVYTVTAVLSGFQTATFN